MNDNYWKESKLEFRKIFDVINEVYKTSNSIIKYVENLDKMYKNLLNYKTNDKNLLYFGLNTFYFQIRFLQSQYEDSKRQFVFLLNHLYADYYKLYKLIIYHVESGSDENLKQKINIEPTFPVYDDLSPYTQYKESDIISLHDFILKILEIIDIENDEFAKSNSINDLQNNHSNGIPIANFIHGLTHEQSIMDEYINLYKHYLEFFQNFYNDECVTYKIKLENLFQHIKDHAPLDSNPLLKKICKISDCSNKTYLNTEYCNMHYKIYKSSSSSDEDEEDIIYTLDKVIDNKEYLKKEEEKIKLDRQEIFIEQEAEEKAKKDAEEKAKKDAEEKAKQEDELKATQEAETKSTQEAETKAKKEAETKAKQEAELKAKKQSEEKSKQEAEEKTKQEANEKTKQVLNNIRKQNMK
uniref:Uncharacterized protein n=1 Tax=viral metagenome TaxID=1070528 RepID=A0A6C0AX99_9ZZZZ